MGEGGRRYVLFGVWRCCECSEELTVYSGRNESTQVTLHFISAYLKYLKSGNSILRGAMGH